MVKADQQTLDPCEEENDDLPLAIVTHLEKKRSTGRDLCGGVIICFYYMEPVKLRITYSRLLISSPRVINRTDVEVPYLGG